MTSLGFLMAVSLVYLAICLVLTPINAKKMRKDQAKLNEEMEHRRQVYHDKLVQDVQGSTQEGGDAN